jgi:hypothetical protein
MEVTWLDATSVDLQYPVRGRDDPLYSGDSVCPEACPELVYDEVALTNNPVSRQIVARGPTLRQIPFADA